MAIPTKPSLLAAYSTNFNTRIVASPSTFNLTVLQATTYTGLHDPYIAAYEAAAAMGARSRSLIAARNTARTALLAYARQLYGFVQSSGSVSNANKELLGVRVRSMPTPQPVPAFAPALDIVSVNGRTVRIRLHDSQNAGRRGKPPGCAGAAVFSFVGAEAPDDPALYTFQGNTTQPKFDVTFPNSVAPGTLVWLTAMWFNERALSGPACTPISTNTQFGSGAAAA